MSDEAVQFLEIVWGERQAFVDLPSKVNGHWIPYHLEWPNSRVARWRVENAVADGEDLYFSVATFSSKGRRYEDTLPSVWLWADLDEVHPEELEEGDFDPTVTWQSSPGRYQALWLLDRECRPSALEQLNRMMTYAVGADKSGWDLTQVLRVPGSRNFKYEGGPEVELLWADGPQYNVKELYQKLKVASPVVPMTQPAIVSTGEARPLPPRALRLLRTPEDHVVQGERSHRLWELLCLMAESNWPPEMISEEVWPCAWNKWRDVGTGRERLEREISKAWRHVVQKRQALPPTGGVATTGTDQLAATSSNGKPTEILSEDGEEKPVRRTSPFVSYADFLSVNFPPQKWLIEDIWAAESHGIVGGEPKANKSLFTMAMALSVASGKPLFGKYRVGTPGPVLIIQEENDPRDVQDTMRKLAFSYGLLGVGDVEEADAPAGAMGEHIVRLAFPAEQPIRFLNNYGFDLTREEDRELLEAECAEIGPVMVVLDPFYLLIGGGDVDKARDVTPFFKYLLRLKYKFGCAVVLCHHMRKADADRGGQRLLGSTLMHGWVSSAMYLERNVKEELEENQTLVKVEREFRAVGPKKPFEIKFTFGDPGSLLFSASVAAFDALGVVLRMAESSPGITVNQIAEALDLDRRTVLARCRVLESEGRVHVEGGKVGRGHSWKVYPAQDNPSSSETDGS